MNHETSREIELARDLLRIEARAIEAAAERLDERFSKAVGILCAAHAAKQKVVFLGVGKSHHIGRKLAASFMSTGVTSIFLHPSEALHGDLGVLRPGDVCVIISKSGATAEILRLLPYLKGRNPTLCITGHAHSLISKLCDVDLDAAVVREACPMNLLPTASTTVALALGDALVASVALRTGFTRADFALYHPGGSLGKRLNQRVEEVMQPPSKCATVDRGTSLKAAAQLMSERPLGACCVVDSGFSLQGIVTEGDLRRAVARGVDMGSAVEVIMTPNPVALPPDLVIEDALAILERPEKMIGCAPVVDGSLRFLGLVRLHDLL
ncbi:MAG: SIS domain-containing protein [Limisphaerales bacterium]